MKKKMCLMAGVAMLVVSCSSTDDTIVTTNRPTVVTKPQPVQTGQYIAAPGRAVVPVGGADLNAAFDNQIAQYGAQPQTGAAMGAAMGQATAQAVSGVLAPLQQTPSPMPPVTAPQNTQYPNYIHQTAVPGQAVVGGAMIPGAAVPMNYSVRIINSTNGRIYVEAQDAVGTIYPCGFMNGGHSCTTPMEQADPIAAPITIVVRDPDKDGAPEIRRFRVNPPAFYSGKTVGISIMSGGKYHASVDGNVYASGEAVAPPAQTPNVMQAVAPMPAPGGTMSYTVKITNTTPGRILVEARDAAGVEFPCGEMLGGASCVTPREQAAPIAGPLTIIVRDPDKEGQPEIRRYKVNPPANYAGKTLGISIVPGGQYHASLDGQVYYTYTPPEAPPTTNPQPQPQAPAPAVTPAPAASPAAAPAPAAEPAGI
ncbi:MAG: hypothetical protein IKA55_05840 [Akkermansia sp.]|nr:hypothetical protein [Akkermansia sp.]